MMNNPRSQPPPRRSTTPRPWAGAGHGQGAPPLPLSVHSSSAASFLTNEARFLAALPVIDDVTGQVCRRHHLTGADAEDFRSDVRLHFIERDYEVLRKFEGRCQLSTYVTIIVQRLFIDRRNRLWGRWRPSAFARRLGPAGVLLERLVTRDGWSAEQALEMLAVNHGVTADAALRRFCESLTGRAPGRRLVAEEDAGELTDNQAQADAHVVRAEQDFLVRRVRTALERARQALSAIDRLVIKMRFEDRVSVADIARALNLDQRRLYRTVEQVLTAIGDSMRADGIAPSDVEALFADDALAWGERGDAGAYPVVGAAIHPSERKGAS
jgi:RNA polymerase sigma factor (sigma-70 family)